MSCHASNTALRLMPCREAAMRLVGLCEAVGGITKQYLELGRRRG